MPDWQQARIEEITLVPPPSEGENTAKIPAAGAGSRMTISIRALPMLPMRMIWDAVIVDFEWDRTFADEQRSHGPFRNWHHRHTVTEHVIGSINGSQIVDELEYELPFGILGDIAGKLVVAEQIRQVFVYRQRRFLELLGANGSAS
jgi:ligand-binding SRPBCC domain-containing protein